MNYKINSICRTCKNFENNFCQAKQTYNDVMIDDLTYNVIDCNKWVLDNVKRVKIQLER